MTHFREPHEILKRVEFVILVRRAEMSRALDVSRAQFRRQYGSRTYGGGMGKRTQEAVFVAA